MTGYKKIAISLPLRAAESVRRAVRTGKAESASAYIAAAIEEKAKKEDWRVLMDEMLATTGGPTTPAERREVKRLLYGPPVPWQQQVAELEKQRARAKRQLRQASAKRRKPTAKRQPTATRPQPTTKRPARGRRG